MKTTGSGRAGPTEFTLAMMEAGVKVFHAWEDDDWEFEDFSGYGNPIGPEGPVQALVRALWFAMQKARQG